MFTAKHYINNISLFIIAFTNSFLLLIISNDLRMPAFLLFLGYLIVFPGLSLISRKGFLLQSKILQPMLFVFLFIFLGYLFLRYDAVGIVPAFAFVFFLMYLVKDSRNNLELMIQFLIFVSAPVMFLEVIFSGTHIPSILLLIIIIFLQNRSSEEKGHSFSFYSLAILSGGILIISASLLIVYCLFVLYVFRYNLLRLIIFSLISFITFIIVAWFISEGMIPEYLNHYFASSLLFTFPLWFLIFSAIVLIYTGWLTSSLQEVYFSSALFIALPVVLILIINIISSGVAGLRTFNYLNELQMAVPLLITSIRDYEVDKFRGKIFPANI